MSAEKSTGDLSPRRGLDPELQAMAKLDRIMSELPPHCVPSVMVWLIGRYVPGVSCVIGPTKEPAHAGD